MGAFRGVAIAPALGHLGHLAIEIKSRRLDCHNSDYEITYFPSSDKKNDLIDLNKQKAQCCQGLGIGSRHHVAMTEP